MKQILSVSLYCVVVVILILCSSSYSYIATISLQVIHSFIGE